MSKISKILPFDSSVIIRHPVVTEKSTGTSTFVVAPTANKTSVHRAIKILYGVAPRRINIINVPGKKIWNRGRLGRSPGFKKALVYLKPGDKIELA